MYVKMGCLCHIMYKTAGGSFKLLSLRHGMMWRWGLLILPQCKRKVVPRVGTAMSCLKIAMNMPCLFGVTALKTYISAIILKQ